MLPPKKEMQLHCPQKTAKVKKRPQSASVNWNVLAERTQHVAPVGVWVESTQDAAEQEESPAFSAVAQIEEEYKEQQKQKEQILKRFQEDVKHRVNQHVKLRRKQQLQESYKAALKESSVVIRFSDSALQLTPKKSTCLYRCSTDSTICGSGSKVISVKEPTVTGEWGEKAQAKTVKKTVQQAVRHRLASQKAVSKGDASPELPGGAWESCPDKEVPESCKTTLVNAEEDLGEDCPLAGYHDLPAELQDQKQEQQGKGMGYIIEFKKVDSEVLKEAYPVACSAAGIENWAPQILWPGREIEESKKQRQSQYLRYRRLFMDIEREQVKEQQRQKEWQRKMDKIKREKEQQRYVEEQRITENNHAEEQRIQKRLFQGHANCQNKLQHLKPGDSKERKGVVEKHQRSKEYARYAEALRAQMREKIKMYNIHLPPLCFCGSDFWDSHPESCANNCVFYKNHKAYAQALQSVISSCNVLDGGSNTRLAVPTFATVHARSKNS